MDFSVKNESVFGGKKISALFAQARHVDTSSAHGNLAVLHNDALMARCLESIVDEIGKSTSQIENGIILLH